MNVRFQCICLTPSYERNNFNIVHLVNHTCGTQNELYSKMYLENNQYQISLPKICKCKKDMVKPNADTEL